jgi:hypothetical protein
MQFDDDLSACNLLMNSLDDNLLMNLCIIIMYIKLKFHLILNFICMSCLR